MNATQAPNRRAYWSMFSAQPTVPSTHRPTPALTPMISESSTWPRT